MCTTRSTSTGRPTFDLDTSRSSTGDGASTSPVGTGSVSGALSLSSSETEEPALDLGSPSVGVLPAVSDVCSAAVGFTTV